MEVASIFLVEIALQNVTVYRIGNKRSLNYSYLNKQTAL